MEEQSTTLNISSEMRSWYLRPPLQIGFTLKEVGVFIAFAIATRIAYDVFWPESNENFDESFPAEYINPLKRKTSIFPDA